VVDLGGFREVTELGSRSLGIRRGRARFALGEEMSTTAVARPLIAGIFSVRVSSW
jgi:hypothetical protein